MGLGRALAVALTGIKGQCIEVEAHLASSIPAFTIVGLPDVSLGESKDRVRAAVTSTALRWPPRRTTVNLVPASLPKAGAGFDLAIAIAVLAADRQLDPASAAGTVHIGELGLDGRLRAVRGVLPAVAAAVAAGHRRVMVPEACLAEAELIPGAEIIAVSNLAQAAAFHGCTEVPPAALITDQAPSDLAEATGGQEHLDLADVIGQPEGRRAIEVAAGGGHHLLMVGPPGAGKTMLARRLPGLLPNLDQEAAVEVTAVHSVAGTFQASGGLMRRPPFEDPHHTATAAAVIGGGSRHLQPGAASRAHRGVLFLDEAPEFSSRVLDTLRQPLEQGEIVIHRAAGTARFPARFQLVLAANPCPCGRAIGKGLACQCTPLALRRYFSRLSGPLLDRVDIQVEVHAVTRARAALEVEARETTAQVSARVAAARRAQLERWEGTPWRTNAEVPGEELRRLTNRGAVAELMSHLDDGRLTLRGIDRVLRVAWTLADLAGRVSPTAADTGMALALRSRGRYGGVP